MIKIKGLHHNAYRCADSAATRRFYEDFLGLPLAGALEIGETKTGRATQAFHTFFEMGDGSYLAFFEVPDMPFEFKSQHDFDLHIALKVDEEHLQVMLAKAREAGMEVRGVSDHEFIHSIYLRDPDGYVVELCAKVVGSEHLMDPSSNDARAIVERWQERKRGVGS